MLEEHNFSEVSALPDRARVADRALFLPSSEHDRTLSSFRGGCESGWVITKYTRTSTDTERGYPYLPPYHRGVWNAFVGLCEAVFTVY